MQSGATTRLRGLFFAAVCLLAPCVSQADILDFYQLSQIECHDRAGQVLKVSFTRDGVAAPRADKANGIIADLVRDGISIYINAQDIGYQSFKNDGSVIEAHSGRKKNGGVIRIAHRTGLSSFIIDMELSSRKYHFDDRNCVAMAADHQIICGSVLAPALELSPR